MAGIKFSYFGKFTYCSFPLVLQTYSEPVEGKFEDATAAILERLRSDDEESGTDSDMDMELKLRKYYFFLIIRTVIHEMYK